MAGTEGSFKSGYFRILPGDSALDVHRLLVSGYQEQVKVTIPEGWTLKEIARHLDVAAPTAHNIVKTMVACGYLGRDEQAGYTLGPGCRDIAREAGIPAPVIEAALQFRIDSADAPSYTGRVVQALRNEFGGHGLAPEPPK